MTTDGIDLTDALERIAAGEIPVALEPLTAIGRGVARVNAFHAQTLAVVVAAGRSVYDLTSDVRGWSKWCAEEFDLTDISYRSHLLAAGKMLNGLLKCGIQHYKKLFALSHDCQYTLTALWSARGADGIVTFFKLHPEAARMSREAVRKAVDAMLGREQPVPAPMVQPELALEFDVLGGIIEDDRLTEITGSEKFDDAAACAMTFNGLALCHAALPKLEQYAAELDLDLLETLEGELNSAHEQINRLIVQKKEKILGL